MSKNIFENAYFGKAYKTRDGRKMIYLSRAGEGIMHKLLGTDENIEFFHDNGQYAELYPLPCDIVSEWQEPIDEEKLNRIKDEWWQTAKYQSNLGYSDCFDAGYRKALSIIGINYENDYQQPL